MRNRSNLGDFNVVAQNKFSTISVDSIGHIYGFMLDCTLAGGVAATEAEIVADIENIYVEARINGKGAEKLVDISPEDLFAVLDWKHATDSGYVQKGVIPIPFTRNKVNMNIVQNSHLGIGTRNVSKVTVTVTYKDNAGFLLNRVTLRGDIDEEISLDIGTYPVLYSEEKEIITVGEKLIEGLPKQIRGGAILSTHFTEGNGTVDEIIHVKMGSKPILQNVNLEEHKLLAHENKRTPQAGMWHIDHQRHRDMLSLNNLLTYSILVKYSVAPDGFRVVYDMLKGVDSVAA